MICLEVWGLLYSCVLFSTRCLAAVGGGGGGGGGGGVSVFFFRFSCCCYCACCWCCCLLCLVLLVFCACCCQCFVVLVLGASRVVGAGVGVGGVGVTFGVRQRAEASMHSASITCVFLTCVSRSFRHTPASVLILRPNERCQLLPPALQILMSTR